VPKSRPSGMEARAWLTSRWCDLVAAQGEGEREGVRVRVNARVGARVNAKVRARVRVVVRVGLAT